MEDAASENDAENRDDTRPIYQCCCVERCGKCEGSGIRPSSLYLIPFWPTMLCGDCKGSGIVGVIPFHAATVYGKAVKVLQRAMHGDQHFRRFLMDESSDAASFRLALMDLQVALKE